LRTEFYAATVEAQNHITHLLNLPATGSEQDWEIELADPSRVDEMIDMLARRVDLNLDSQCALALLTISSMEVAEELGKLKPLSVKKMALMLPTHPLIAARMYFYWVTLRRLLNPEFGDRIFSAGKSGSDNALLYRAQRTSTHTFFIQ
jgi:hypothetical protein